MLHRIYIYIYIYVYIYIYIYIYICNIYMSALNSQIFVLNLLRLS